MTSLENPKHKLRFERAKAFSDYLGFHIRLSLFGIFGLFALAIPVSRMLAERTGGPAFSPTDHLLEFAIAFFCFSMSLAMLIHIFGVGRSFLIHYLKKQFVRIIVYPIYWLLTIGSLSAISLYGSFQLLSTLGIDAFQFECSLNSYLQATNYWFTPSKPSHCE